MQLFLNVAQNEVADVLLSFWESYRGLMDGMESKRDSLNLRSDRPLFQRDKALNDILSRIVELYQEKGYEGHLQKLKNFFQ